MTQFDIQYKQAIWEIMNEGYEEYNERTGHKTKIVPGTTFHLDNGFPILTLRKIPIKIFVAEQVWFLTGSNKPEGFLRDFTKIWDDFTEEDGTVAAAYGYRWRHHFGRDQIADLIKHLKEQPGSRHAVVMAWDPSDDGLGSGTKKKNVPCPYTFTVNIIGNRLHIHSIVRSNDMILGCPHDVAGFALLQHILAAKLGVKSGRLTHSISNAHIYDIHYKAAWEILEREQEHPDIYLNPQPDWFDRAENADRELVEEITHKLSKQYFPIGADKRPNNRIMRIIMMMAVTMDGKIAKNEKHFPDWTCAEDKKYFYKLSKECGVVIMGEKTFDTFPSPLKERLNVVFTLNPDRPMQENVKWVSGEPKPVVEEIVRMGFKSAILGGGAGINSLFLKNKLIDEIIITVEPKIFGVGLSLFADEFDVNLNLIGLEKLNNDSVALKYKVNY